jgi:glutamyl-tRNA reductase
MGLLSFGINHKTAPVDIRERVSFAPDKLDEALNTLLAVDAVKEAAILSTCNRTEVYCGVQGESAAPVFDWFSHFHHLKPGDIKPYSYAHPDDKAVRHMLRVASGLDSLVLGEPQILGQLKDAWRRASDVGTLGKVLNRLFQHSFRVAKQVRTDTAIGSSPVSVAFAAVSLARKIFASLADKTVLLVGAGETIELVARHLAENQIERMIIANRSVEKAHHLASGYQGYGIGLTEIADHLHEADIVISSTASPLPVIGKGMVESALKKRRHQPMFMVDIAVPRDIEAEIGNLDDVYLYTVDDLHDVINENMKSRQDAAKQAEEIIDIQVDHFCDWLFSQNSVGVIQSYRHVAHDAAEELAKKARNRIAAGQDPHEVVDALVWQLTNRLIHHPCSQLRRATVEEQTQLVDAARTLFGLSVD